MELGGGEKGCAHIPQNSEIVDIFAKFMHSLEQILGVSTVAHPQNLKARSIPVL